MMENYIETQAAALLTLVKKWAAVDSSTHNEEGKKRMLEILAEDFSSLSAERVNPQNPHVLHLKKRPSSSTQILLAGHLDTVLPARALEEKDGVLKGSGVADMKGGLAILFKALEAFERAPCAQEIGWEILINDDEERGSPNTHTLFEECAKRKFQCALLFEPAMPDGSLISARKGSRNYLITSHGKAAHAGRNHREGKNAIFPLAQFITALEKYNVDECVVNVGHIAGGLASNIVPDFASAQINVRAFTQQELQNVEEMLKQLAVELGLQVELTTSRPPKLFDPQTKHLFSLLKNCGESLEIPLSWQESGGVTDGNILASFGLPTIDTLGVVGGGLHRMDEYLLIESLVQRTQLTFKLLAQVALGDAHVK